MARRRSPRSGRRPSRTSRPSRSPTLSPSMRPWRRCTRPPPECTEPRVRLQAAGFGLPPLALDVEGAGPEAGNPRRSEVNRSEEKGRLRTAKLHIGATTTPKRFDCGVSWPIRGMPARSSASVECTTLAKACGATTRRPTPGSEGPPTKDLPTHSSTSAWRTRTAGRPARGPA